MKEYHKIQSVFKRDIANGKIIEGKYSLPEFEYLKDNQWVFTEKVDGTNIRIIWQPQEMQAIRIAGRTDKASIPTFLYDKLNEIFTYEKMKVLGTEIDNYLCLYGEGYGAKIQKGGGNYIKDGVNFVLFDVKIGNFWLKREDVEDIAQKLNLKVVPIIGKGTLDKMVKKVKIGFKSQWGDFIAEGIVAKPEIELKNRRGDRILTKIKYRDFN
jgi:ATP-dependent RNA circularization protein (DNA/RNA ligase family)